MILRNLFFLLFLTTCGSIYSQSLGFQFYQGVNKPLVSFSGDNGTLDYKSDFNSDTRIGLFFGNLDKISASALFGASSTKAIAMNDDIGNTAHKRLREGISDRNINTYTGVCKCGDD